ncbi:MAG: complex I NDUFA9 subunit family protein [Mariprofundaceae bacterium]|nr:complex I NDUFA9 subunit family protein [Mariprofundaceae bacterium]
MSKQVCIIGGSGFVGRAMVRQAVRAGYTVVVACRHPERARDLLVEGVSLVKADVTTGRGLDEAVAGSDCVINLVGLLFERGRYSFDAAHVKGTEHVIEAVRRSAVTRYLHMSALGAGKIPESRYARSKGEAETRVRRSGLCWTIFRPSVIFGEGDSFLNRFKAMSRFAPVLPVIAGETRFQPVWVEDVARAFIASIDNRHLVGKVFELAGPKRYSFMQLMQLLMRCLGRNRLLLPVPGFAAKIMAAFMQLLPVPLLTPDQLKLLQHDSVVDGEPFPAVFGTPSALEEVLPTYIRNGQAGRLQSRLDDSRARYRKLR